MTIKTHNPVFIGIVFCAFWNREEAKTLDGVRLVQPYHGGNYHAGIVLATYCGLDFAAVGAYNGGVEVKLSTVCQGCLELQGERCGLKTFQP